MGPASRPHETTRLLRGAGGCSRSLSFSWPPGPGCRGTADAALSLERLQASAGLHIMVTLRFPSGPGKTNSTIRGTHLDDVI